MTDLRCLNFGGPHLSTNHSCSSRKDYRKVDDIMTESNIGFKEALTIKDSYSNDYKFGNNRNKSSNRARSPHKSRSKNWFSPLESEDFPELASSQKSKPLNKKLIRSKYRGRLSYPAKKKKKELTRTSPASGLNA